MNFKKIFLTFIIFISTILCSYASEIDSYIHSSNIETKSTLGVYLINSQNGKVLYKKNEKKLLSPASTLKALTFGASYIAFGKDYEFKTILYRDNKNNIYLKLSADTLLDENDLDTLIKNLKTKISTSQIKNIYIDDTIIDKIPYPQSWMQEDIWPNSAPISPYIINKNMVEISLKRSSLGTYSEIIQNDDYKFSIINKLKTGNIHEYNIEKRYDAINPIISFNGIISKDEIVKLPVMDPELNFKIKFKKILNKNDIITNNPILNKKVPNNAIYLTSVSHTIEDISKNILYNSNNYDAEIIFKAAGAKFKNYSQSGSFNLGMELFNTVFSEELLKEKNEISIQDASGVSRKNLVSSEFMANCLIKLFKNNDLILLFDTPTEGTLKERLVFLKNNLRAKTGTLKNVSTIAGTLKSANDNDLIFVIMVQNSPKRKALIKNFENNLISIFYKKY